MTKLVVLKLDGDLLQGVRVTLEIGSEGERASIEMTGFLPPAPEMTQVYDQWKDGYHRLGRQTRITPVSKIIDGDITPQRCLENAELVRSRLNEWLRSPGFVPLREKCFQQLQPDEEVRVLIRTSSETLQKLPWQLWELIETYHKAGVALSATEYERPASDNRPRDRNQVKKQIKILAILGDSTGINVDEDRKILENLPDAKTTFLVEPQLEQISDQLWEQSWDILFFAGHSRSEGETGRIYINKTDSLRIDELKHGLERAKGNRLQLAIFNSCDGLGLGRALQRLQIPQMIVMREPVPDQIAQRYLKYLLQAFIIENKKLYLAEREARERLEVLKKEFPCASWLPILIQHPAVIPLTRDRLGGISNNSSTAQGKGTQLKGQEFRNRRDLLTQVKQEVASRLGQLLPEASSIKLHKEKQPQQVAPYWDVDAYASDRRTTPLPPNTEIIDLFDKEAVDKLVILGTPGSGKTITLLELARELIHRAESDHYEPMPVLLNLSSWKDDNQTIAQWVVAELKSNRGVPQNIGERWLKNCQLLLLLDGLDELKERQLLCIEAINRFEQDNRLQPIVVCTRLEEYEFCRIKLQFNEAICLKPLNSNQIQQYLEQAGHSQLWHSIQDDRSLQELAKSPLLLRIITLASLEISLREWHSLNSSGERLRYLFNAYISRMLERDISQRWYASGKEPTPEQTERWLGYLAKMLKQEVQTEFLIEKMQPYWLQNRVQKRLYRILVGLMTGLILVFSGSSIESLIKVLVVGLSEGQVALWGLIVAPIVAVKDALISGLFLAMLGGLCKGWTYSPIGGSILGAILGLVDGYFNLGFIEKNNLNSSLQSGLIYGLIFGTLIGGLGEKIRTVETLKFSWIRAKRGIVYGLIIGGFIGMILLLSNSISKATTIKQFIDLIFDWMFQYLIGCLLLTAPLGALLGGIAGPNIDIKKRTIPNQGIWQSVANAGIFVLISGLIGGLILFIIFIITHTYTGNKISIYNLYQILIISIIYGAIGGMIPGFACIQHLSLRIVLCWRGLIPWNYTRFLNYATEKRLLQKVGGRYLFIHNLLQEHFAQMQ